MSAYWIILIAMAVMAVITFVTLFRKEAGYGYLSTGKWGPVISNRIAWVIEEAPAFLLMLFYTLRYAFSGENYGNCNPVLYILAGFYLLHYFQRSFIFPLLMRGNSTMPVSIMSMGVTFNMLNSYLIGTWLFSELSSGRYAITWLTSPQFIIGAVVFFVGMGINLHSDYVIRHLRKPGDTKHYIPTKGFYRWVTSANYFGELVEWIGFAILTWSPAGALFAIWTFANLAPRSKSLTKKYIKEFGDEYKSLGKKNMIPFIW